MYDGAELCHVLKSISFKMYQIDHFTVVCSVTWPLNGSEAAGDLALIKTSLLFLGKSSCSYANQLAKGEVCIKARSPSGSLVTKYSTVKCHIILKGYNRGLRGLEINVLEGFRRTEKIQRCIKRIRLMCMYVTMNLNGILWGTLVALCMMYNILIHHKFYSFIVS